MLRGPRKIPPRDAGWTAVGYNIVAFRIWRKVTATFYYSRGVCQAHKTRFFVSIKRDYALSYFNTFLREKSKRPCKTWWMRSLATSATSYTFTHRLFNTVFKDSASSKVLLALNKHLLFANGTNKPVTTSVRNFVSSLLRDGTCQKLHLFDTIRQKLS